MLTLKFYKFKERKPEHNQEIVYIKPSYSFDSCTFEPSYETVEYCWFELDENGEHNGCQICYTEGDEANPPENCKLEIMVGPYIVDENWYWCTIDEYFNSFDEADYNEYLPST